MMTCRLLCALLVLAFCCSPSVCAENEALASSQTTTTTTTKAGVNNDEANIKAVGKDAGQSPSPPHPSQGTGQPGSSILEPVAKLGNGGGGGSVPTSTGTNEVSNALKAGGNKGTTGSSSDKILSEEQANRESEDSTEETTTTTTTTTKAPTTTTTTTTQAPSNTTTEVPTVSTTRAPSSLREIDGSLSSSAWVCAPLVLAASALAYTAVG
ncbi:mucin TcMUCII [Trypanosoma cruzi cruzi]|uniref:Putative mucin TcMUCII n=1 Tax=Trypanosoma cruzi TaxID=5693 RepID=A0A2V2V361_TRYCR|nr:mucin TcMUCII [Trypanosoma cruzi cruzi]PWU88843.1 putative mucin TcMUCII [Trypanosoma cruzi]